MIFGASAVDRRRPGRPCGLPLRGRSPVLARVVLVGGEAKNDSRPARRREGERFRQMDVHATALDRGVGDPTAIIIAFVRRTSRSARTASVRVGLGAGRRGLAYPLPSPCCAFAARTDRLARSLEPSGRVTVASSESIVGAFGSRGGLSSRHVQSFGVLVVAPAQELRAVAEAVALHLVVAHLDDELRPDRRLLELAGAPAVRLGEAPVRRVLDQRQHTLRRRRRARAPRPRTSRRSPCRRRRGRARAGASRSSRGRPSSAARRRRSPRSSPP